ncbi:hypothetical protein Lal_00030156 [Lupinus albus]|nr:hypothetical protein Lal_00030156 [Lupinus albus]
MLEKFSSFLFRKYSAFKSSKTQNIPLTGKAGIVIRYTYPPPLGVVKSSLYEIYDILYSYMPLWKIIDDIWDKQLYRQLHAALYFLNLQLHYALGFTVDLEVRNGLSDVIGRKVHDIQDQSKIVV